MLKSLDYVTTSLGSIQIQDNDPVLKVWAVYIDKNSANLNQLGHTIVCRRYWFLNAELCYGPKH